MGGGRGEKWGKEVRGGGRIWIPCRDLPLLLCHSDETSSHAAEGDKKRGQKIAELPEQEDISTPAFLLEKLQQPPQ